MIDDVATLLTGAGRSAIAVIGVRGKDAKRILDQFFTPATNRPYIPGEIRYGSWKSEIDLHGKLLGKNPQSSSGESVVVVLVDSSQFEVHCHGGAAAIDRIRDDLQAAGVHIVEPHGTTWQVSKAPLVREAESVLTNCTTDRFATIALDQIRGAMQKWCDRVLMDASDATLENAKNEAKRMLQYADLGTRLTTQFHVVFAGPPNVGKSSLINAILGYDRSITMDSPGTTRDVLHTSTVIDGIPLRLSDTAGIRDATNEIESQGIERAANAICNADLVVWVTQPDFAAPTETSEIVAVKAIHVLNKADLLPEAYTGADWIQTSATLGQGIENLMHQISKALIPTSPASGTPVPITKRQVDCLTKIASSKDVSDLQRHVDDLISL